MNVGCTTDSSMCQWNREARTATITVRAPESVTEDRLEMVVAAGANWWPLQMARELDDAILTLRASELDLGLWIIKTAGNPDAVLTIDEFILNHQDNWFVREVLGMMRRTFARIDVTSRSIYAIVEAASCFAGTLVELALAADRIYMRDTQEGGSSASMTLSKMNFGPLPMVNRISRMAARFYGDEAHMEARRGEIGKKLPRARRWRRAWLPPHRMISTGKTRFGKPLNRGPRIARCTHRARSESALRTGGDAGDADFRTALRLAKLDIHPSERRRCERRAQGVRDRSAGEIQLGTGLMDGLESGLLRRSR